MEEMESKIMARLHVTAQNLLRTAYPDAQRIGRALASVNGDTDSRMPQTVNPIGIKINAPTARSHMDIRARPPVSDSYSLILRFVEDSLAISSML